MSTADNRPFAWHVHHTSLYERLRGPDGLAQRQRYIREQKPPREQARRLRLLRVVINQNLLEALEAARAVTLGDSRLAPVRKVIKRAIDALHREECKGRRCTWNGNTIFPKRRKAGK